MPTKNIECQLAQGQIGRYLNGDRFSDEAVRQLEAHIAECDECSELLADRKKAVMAMLGEVATTRAAVHMEGPAAAPKPAEKLITALVRNQVNLKQSAVEEPAPAPKATFNTFFPKPVLYTGALALVLMGMSYFSRGALKFFGPTASQAYTEDAPKKAPVQASPAASAPPSTPAQSQAPSGATSTTNPTPAPSATAAAQKQAPAQPSLERVAPPTPVAARSFPSSSTPTAHPTPLKAKTPAPHKPVAKPKAAAPKPIVHKAVTFASAKPKVRVGVHRWAAHRPWRPIHHSGVRVYDAQGRPLK